MSIIRQRKKNMILAWFLGGVVTAVFVAVLVSVFSLYDLTTYFDFAKDEVVDTTVYVNQVVAAKAMPSGTVLTEENLMEIQIPESQSILGNLDMSRLIGREVNIDVDQYLPITLPMVDKGDYTSDEQRLYEFDFVKLPIKLEVGGEVVDIRIVFPNGQDYVVLAKKRSGSL